MQSQTRFFDDLARVASGAFGTLAGVRDEVQSRLREQLERVLAGMDLVSREEFDAAKAMVAKARAEQEALLLRVAALEAAVAAGAGAGGGVLAGAASAAAVPGAMSGAIPGTAPGAIPGAIPGAVPGAIPGAGGLGQPGRPGRRRKPGVDTADPAADTIPDGGI